MQYLNIGKNIYFKIEFLKLPEKKNNSVGKE